MSVNSVSVKKHAALIFEDSDHTHGSTANDNYEWKTYYHSITSVYNVNTNNTL